MIDLKILQGDGWMPKGFWLTFLWIFAIGLKNDEDNVGSFIMLSIAIWRLQAHFTLSFDTR